MRRVNILNLEFQMGENIIEIHPVLLKEGKELILCDAGYPNQLSQIESELHRYGHTINDLTKVIITHHDHDHIGSLELLKNANPSLELISSKLEKSFIDGSEKSLLLLKAEKHSKELCEEKAGFWQMFANYLATINKIDIDRTVEENDYIASGIKIISTPGHTPGHLSVLLEEESIIIVGDAFTYENNQLAIANPECTFDIDECMNSIKKIRDLKLKKLICYHGGLVETNSIELLNKLLKEETV